MTLLNSPHAQVIIINRAGSSLDSLQSRASNELAQESPDFTLASL